MKKEEVPQDFGALGKVTKEVCYVTDTSGKYVTELSNGWDVKTSALDTAWKEIDQRIAAASRKVILKEASPLLYFMEYRMMDISLLSEYTGYWKWQIKRHLKPAVFEKLSDKRLQKYASAFNVTLEELKAMVVHDS